MISTANVTTAANAGSTLRRLNPREIATMLLPGTSVQVMDATDAQFQASIASQVGIPEDATGWSYDDRCRLINHYRKLGVDLFVRANENSSPAPAQTIPNNLETLSDEELMEHAESASQRHPDEGTPILDGWAAIIKTVLTTPPDSSEPAGAKGE